MILREKWKVVNELVANTTVKDSEDEIKMLRDQSSAIERVRQRKP